MIERLKQIDFPIKQYLTELDKKQLVFIYLYCLERVKLSKKDELTINSLDEVIIEDAGDITKLTKDGLISKILGKVDCRKLDTTMFRKLYIDDSTMDYFERLFLKAVNLVTTISYISQMNTLLNKAFTEDNYIKINSNQSEELISKLLENYCNKQKPCSNILGLTNLLLLLKNITRISLNEKSDSVEKEVFPNLLNAPIETLMAFECSILEYIIFWYNIVNAAKKTEKENLTKTICSMEEVIQKQKIENKKLIDLNKTLKDEKQALQRSISEMKKEPAEDSKSIFSLIQANSQKDLQIQKLSDDLQDIKNKPSKIYNTMIDNLNNQIIDAKILAKSKADEAKDWKGKYDKLSSKSILLVVDEYLKNNQFNDQLYEILTPYYEQFAKLRAEKETVVELEKEKQEIQNQMINTQDKIGYCIIENGKYYIVFPKGQKQELFDPPENFFISEYQFILVSYNNHFKWAYSNIYEELPIDYKIVRFGSVKVRNDMYYIDCGNAPMEKILNVPNTVTLQEDNVIGVDSQNNFIRYTKRLTMDAASIMKSVQLRGFTMAFIIKMFSNGLLLRDVVTGDEYVKTIDLKDLDIKEHQTLILDGDKVVNIFKGLKFYTNSSIYNKSQCGNIDIVNGNALIKKISGEIAIVKNIPDYIQLEAGQVISIDEFNNFLYINHLPDSLEKPASKKSQYSNSTKKENDEEIKLDKKVTIIGNIAFETSYKLAMMKGGYNTTIVDGMDSSWGRVQASVKDVDVIVVVTNFISHDNMWRLKDAVNNIPIIYAKNAGANRILEDILNYKEKNIEIVS